MPKITEHTLIEDGIVMGKVSTNLVGSECTFEICSVEEWEELSEKDGEKMAQEALFGSGMMEWNY